MDGRRAVCGTYLNWFHVRDLFHGQLDVANQQMIQSVIGIVSNVKIEKRNPSGGQNPALKAFGSPNRTVTRLDATAIHRNAELWIRGRSGNRYTLNQFR